MTADTRSFVGGNFVFTLDDIKCGFIKKVEGGSVSAEVVKNSPGGDYWERKTIGKPKYDPIKFSIGWAHTKNIFNWIKETWKHNFMRKKGTIEACNSKMEVQSILEFYEALIQEVGIPALDASSKEAAYLNLSLDPEYTRYKKGDGKKPSSEYGKFQQKTWIPSNFRVEIAGLDCKKIRKVDALTVKSTTQRDEAGDQRDNPVIPGKLECPNVKITLSAQGADSWWNWHEEMVIKGNTEMEKNIALVFLNQKRDKEISRVNLTNCGIFKLSASAGEAMADAVKTLDAELYAEEIDIEYADAQI